MNKKLYVIVHGGCVVQVVDDEGNEAENVDVIDLDCAENGDCPNCGSVWYDAEKNVCTEPDCLFDANKYL